MIKILHLLSVIVFCTVQLIEGSIYNELKNYYDSDSTQEYKEEWKIFRRGFENEIVANLRETFGSTAVNIYEPGRNSAHLLARGFQLTDGVVMVYFYEMILRELPQLLRPKLEMDLPSNVVKFESKLGRMLIDTTYYVARNSSSIVYARPQDQKFLSPFSLQQVDNVGKLVIIVEDCLLSGIAISTLSGDSVSMGHSPFMLTDCKLFVEISTPNSGAPPVISPYFPPGPKELLEMIIARPIRDELQTKLQGAMYSYINTSVIFEQPAVYRNNQQKLFKSYYGFMTDYVSDLNRNTIKQNKAHVSLPDYEASMNTEVAQTRLRCQVAIKNIVLYGLDTAYATRAGGPYNDGSTQTAADAIVFSSMQIRGKITHKDANGTSTKDFAIELTDVTVILVILIEEEKPKLLQIHFTGWRKSEFSIIPRQTSIQDRHDHQSLVYGYILNELPVRVLNHVTSIIGHGPIDGNKEDNGDASGGGGDNGDGGDNGGGGDNGEGIGGGDDKNRSGENDDSPSTKLNNKAKDFFSDDVLEDNFFSDDGLDKNFIKDDLDKNFISDDLDKNFFNDSKETTPNKGDFTDIDDGNDEKPTTIGYDEDTISAVTGSDNIEDNMDGDDGGGVSNVKEGDDNNIAAGGDVDILNVSIGEQKNGNADDPNEENKPGDDNEKLENTNLESDNGDDNEPVDDEDPGNSKLEDENKPVSDFEEPVDEKFIDKNLETDFLSDDFIKTDFFSDDDFDADFGSKEQGDATGNNKNEGNGKDQIDNADDGNDVLDDNGEQVDKDGINIDGNSGHGVEGNDGDDEDQIDNANDNGNDVLDGNVSDGKQMNKDDKNIDDDDDGSGEVPEKENNEAEDYTKRPASTGASDDDKPFFSDVLNENLFSDENINGDKKTLKGTLDKDFFSVEDTNGTKKKLNNKQNKGGTDGLEDSDGENDKENVNKGDKKLVVFASDESKKEGLSGEGFFSDIDFELDSAESSRRHMSRDKNTANEQSPKNPEGNHSDVDQKPIEEKHTSKENVTENVEDSREDKKIVLPSNVHNTRRLQNLHTSENEIR